jgi:hypothetical protein
MFKKLDAKMKKQKIKEKAVSFPDVKSKKLFEKSIIFGNLLETLDSLDIEEAYKGTKTEEKKNG